MEKEQLLYQYFSGTLTPEQEKEFNALLSSDTEFKAQFAFEQSLQKVIQDKEGKALKNKLKDFEADIKQNTKPVIKLNFQKWSIAASIVLLVGIGWLGYNSAFGTNYNTLYEDNFQQYPNTVYSITRGAEEDNSLERKAFVAYETNDIVSAIELLTALNAKEENSYVDFYLAQAYLNNNEPKKAIPFFKEVIAEKGEFSSEAMWYTALSYLKLKDKEKAKLALKDVIATGNYKTTEAELLLQELE
ncbi:tetratricopeptide repeat protein [Maribacter vaceletii]|uniref:Tetratricopeptide repeat protein n=1 Tax=Maribacter vaceletii TaxID=1206816 RepID=A0A495EEV9_9FLAO|nr:tetratricopeptide repeat protein [Maribacter vaceletii]RKR15415.1 tetratricopeptide repeat protein [Maribacter vaceletii]